jgi:glycosyltransferase involved in cell wall biosynthesis
MRVLHVVESLDPRCGGTAVSISQAANQLAERGADVTILVLDGSNQAQGLLPQIRVCQCQSRASWKKGFAFGLQCDLAILGKTDLVHIHGLWRLLYSQVAYFASNKNLPVVLSTHGMMEPPALGHHRFRKRLARMLYQDTVLKGVRCLHTTASSEADSLNRLGFRQAIAIIPWGIDVPLRNPPGIIPQRSRRTALYLSRFHPIKGLDLLLRAWAVVGKTFPEWDLVLAGYDENGYCLHLQALADSLGISQRVIFRGPLQGQEKEAAFGAAELFLLTSHSESFGLAVGEAMARGLPVITTTGTPWASVPDWGCGWYIEPNVPAITRTLSEALAQPGPTLRQMGERGRELVATRFSVDCFGEAMANLYSWLLGRRDKPSFVRAD